MTGDPHDRTARRATLLVTAADEILGTHRLINKIKGDITQLTDIERAAVDDAVAVARRHRSAHSPVSLGTPAIRTPLPSPLTESLA